MQQGNVIQVDDNDVAEALKMLSATSYGRTITAWLVQEQNRIAKESVKMRDDVNLRWTQGVVQGLEDLIGFFYGQRIT